MAGQGGAERALDNTLASTKEVSAIGASRALVDG